MRLIGQIALLAIVVFDQLFGKAESQTYRRGSSHKSFDHQKKPDLYCYPNEYILVAKDGAEHFLEKWLHKLPYWFDVQILSKYQLIFNGVAVRVKHWKEFEKAISGNKYIEIWDRNCKFSTDEETPWHLDRIDQHELPLDNNFAPMGTGQGVNIYIVDTGINIQHSEFGGRAQFLYSLDGVQGDCNGHGTFVAGLAAGTKYGVAKEANLFEVRVFGDCLSEGAFNVVLDGLEAILRVGRTPGVINLSLAVKIDLPSANKAVENLIERGFVVVAAAGNAQEDACLYSPANVPSAIAVGATDIEDQIASFSNFGECVDLFAPGVDVTSASHLSDTENNINSGTSFAAPLVTGVAAILLEINPELTPAEITSIIVNGATSGVISGLELTNSPNQLLFIPQSTKLPPEDPIKQPDHDLPSLPFPRCSRDYNKMLQQNQCISDCGVIQVCHLHKLKIGPDSWVSYCPLGSDCNDCSTRDASLCSNHCSGAENGICEDEQGNKDCPFGSDCDDCGIRCFHEIPNHIDL